ncbi:MAG TPA: hypothetical protein VG454_03040 [Gemmatimonadales bacterium]|nr:hypothetical protein [Gemmatimonadales bacterium]
MKRALGIACVCAVVGVSTLPPIAVAQHFNAAVTGAPEIVQSHIDSSFSRLNGSVFGGEGTFVAEHFAIRLRYAQGNVSAKSDTGIDHRQVVEGEALVGYRATQWLTLWAGPTARAYTVGDADQRWLLWSARVTGRGTLLPDKMQTYVELWGALSGTVGNPAMKAGGRGADMGLELRLSSETPLWGRLGYRIQSSHADGLRETVEAITLSVIYGFPQ